MLTRKIAGRVWHFQCRWPVVSFCTGSTCICDVVAKLDNIKPKSIIPAYTKSYFRIAWPATAGWLFSFVFTLCTTTVTALTLWCQFGILALLQLACVWLWRKVYRMRAGRVTDDDDVCVKRSIERTCRRSDLEFQHELDVERTLEQKLEESRRLADSAQRRLLEAEANRQRRRDAVIVAALQQAQGTTATERVYLLNLPAIKQCSLCFGELDEHGVCTRNPEHQWHFNHPVNCPCGECVPPPPPPNAAA